MKLLFLAVALVACGLSASTCLGQTVAVETSKQTMGSLVEPFSGKIVFHQKEGPTVYDVTITNGRVSGHQFLGSDPDPIGDFVGGWFDYKTGRLSLLIQVTAKGINERWRSQAQQFLVDPKTKEVTLQHMLFDYGATLDNSGDLVTAHILDSFDATVHLVN